MTRPTVAILGAAVGLALVAAAGWLVYPPAGLAVAGVGLAAYFLTIFDVDGDDD